MSLIRARYTVLPFGYKWSWHLIRWGRALSSWPLILCAVRSKGATFRMWNKDKDTQQGSNQASDQCLGLKLACSLTSVGCSPWQAVKRAWLIWSLIPRQIVPHCTTDSHWTSLHGIFSPELASPYLCLFVMFTCHHFTCCVQVNFLNCMLVCVCVGGGGWHLKHPPTHNGNVFQRKPYLHIGGWNHSTDWLEFVMSQTHLSRHRSS